MINLIDKTGTFPDDEFYERKNFIVDTHLCTHMETPSMEYQMKKTLTNQLMGKYCRYSIGGVKLWQQTMM